MSSLNDPVGYDQPPAGEWSPQRGTRRAAFQGSLVAGLLFALLTFPAANWPYLLLPWLPRTILAFLLTWMLVRVVLASAGMYSPALLRLGLALAAAVLLGEHVLFALRGVPASAADVGWFAWPLHYVDEFIDTGSVSIGGRWLHPYVLLIVNAGPLLIGGTIGALLNRD